MKYLLSILFICSTLSVDADIAPYGDFSDFTPWLYDTEFEKKVEEIPEGSYPILIQAGPLVGDGVVYRYLLIPKPTKDFEYKFIYGQNEQLFKKQNLELIESGFILIYHQTIQLMGGEAHQAVWTKHNYIKSE